MSTVPQSMKAYAIPSRSVFWPIQAALSANYANQCELVTRPVPSPKGEQLLVKNEVFAAVRLSHLSTLCIELISPESYGYIARRLYRHSRINYRLRSSGKRCCCRTSSDTAQDWRQGLHGSARGKIQGER
jgi:hypothetical protein